MFQSRKEAGVAHPGVNILVNRYPDGGEDGKEVYLIEVYSLEPSRGNSTHYAQALRHAFGPARAQILAKVRKDIADSKAADGEAMSKAKTGDQKAKVQAQTQEHIEKLKQRLQNPLHMLNKDEAEAILNAGIQKLMNAGLRLKKGKCNDEFNLEMHESYRLYV